MLYPNTQPSGFVGSGQDNKKRLMDLLSKTGAAPLFGSSGHSASVETLPSVGAPGLSFNPFLKMLAGRPGETFNQLPAGISGALAAGTQNGPPPALQGFQGSSVQTTSAPASSGAAAPQSANPFNNAVGDMGHFNDTYVAPGSPMPSQPTYAPQATDPNAAMGPNGIGIGMNNPFYHLLLNQLAMYGQDR